MNRSLAVKTYGNMVHGIAGSYAHMINRQGDYWEMVQEGYMGLIKAVDKCNNEESFPSYARIHIKGAITDWIERQTTKSNKAIYYNDNLVKIGSYYDDYVKTVDYERYKERLYIEIPKLSEREQYIISTKWLNEADYGIYTKLSKELSISVERVRQVEKQTLQKLKCKLEK